MLSWRTCPSLRLPSSAVTDWLVTFLAAVAFIMLLAGLLLLALPDPYEGGILYSFDPDHSVRDLDGVGVLLVAVGILTAWGAGVLWQRKMIR